MTPIVGQPVVLACDDPSQVGEARRAASALAGRLGFDETWRGKAALVTTELATNLVKHAREGLMILQGVERGEACGLEVFGLDRGPGIADVGRCLVDGYSTAGSPGNGLGALGRVASTFEIHSVDGLGTAVVARLWPDSAEAKPPAGMESGVVSVPMPGEEVCGDAWAVSEEPGVSQWLVVDGLGHGIQAAEAAREAVRVFHDQAHLGPTGILGAAHTALRSTRGAAMAIARVDRNRGEVRYAGIGNIAGVVLDGGPGRGSHMVSQNGIVGHAVRKVQEFVYPWSGASLLVMHSDGLGTQWSLDRYPGLVARHPALVAGTLFRDVRRGRDDVTVLAARGGASLR